MHQIMIRRNPHPKKVSPELWQQKLLNWRISEQHISCSISAASSFSLFISSPFYFTFPFTLSTQTRPVYWGAPTAEAAGGPGAYAAMMDYLPESSEGRVCLPCHAGRRMPIDEPAAKGVLFGLKLGHGRGHIYRAALEGVACSLWQNVRLMEDAGLPVAAVTAVGGGTKNPAWMQITADVSGKRILVPAVTVGASYGDALMAAVGTGRLSGFAELKSVIRPGRVYTPDPAAHERYGVLREVYTALYPATRELMHRL